MTKVNWGILSTAGIAQKELIPAFERATNAEVTAIATGSGIGKAQVVAKKFGIEKIYDSYQQLLDDPEIDAVYIPLPNHLHKKWVIEAAKKGKHILCEKPAAMNTDEVSEMKQACTENNILFMEAFMYSFHPQHDRVKEMIDAGEIGEVKSMQAVFTYFMGNERKEHDIRMSDEMGGGSIYDIGCYGIHALRNILRSEPESVHTHAVTDPQYHVDTDVLTYLTFPGGVRATFEASFNQTMRNEYRVFGTKGTITVPRAFRPDIHGGDGQIIVEKSNETRIETINGDQYRNQVEHISRAILNGDSLDSLAQDFPNTINNMRVIDACFQSIADGVMVKL